MSLTQRKRHVTRNSRARKLVRDFLAFREDCLNNNDLQVLNRTIAEITDILNDDDDPFNDNCYDWPYSWDEDNIDEAFYEDNDDDFLDTKIIDQEPTDEELLPSPETPSKYPLPPQEEDDEAYYILSRNEVEALLNKLSIVHYSTLCNHI